MQTLLIVIHIITCVILVITVLLQQGKGAEVGAVFGSSEAIFGSAGPATLLSKITTACAIIFMLTSLSLTYLSIQKRGESVMHGVKQMPVAPVTQSVPSGQGAGQQMPLSSEKVKGKNAQKMNSTSETKNQSSGVKIKSDVVPHGKESVEPEKGKIKGKSP